MTVKELAELYISTNEQMNIWSYQTEAVVFEGSFGDAMESEYAYCEVCNFGIEDGIIVFNIDQEEDI